MNLLSFLVYAVSGSLFAVGMIVSGMIDPANVLRFLDVTSSEWGPELLFVLGSATSTYLLAFLWLKKRGFNLSKEMFPSPAQRPIDRRLLLGSVIFGAGWGLIGLCPGPALTQVFRFDFPMILFVLAMFLGFELHRRWGDKI